MANYLPVLLVSVTAGMPDDASLQPLPRGQVDYLSHDWAEEDVWRSWRSMTKQKHEIANGVRLENASWRTWMKQRNKLKTVSPETLNWLKDSDVTWLYGPLHTAVDWSPPPRLAISPPVTQQAKDDTSAKAPTTSNSFSSPSSSANLSHLNQARDHLGLQHEGTAKKPILKHRSIAEMLTSALPPAPLWAEESNEFADDHSFLRSHEGKDGIETISQQERPEPSSSPARPTRPLLFHTKSDTNILTSYGRGGAPKKPSPPRGSSHRESEAAAPQVHHSSLSASQRTGASNNLTELVHGTGAPSHLIEPQRSASPFRAADPLASTESSGTSVHEVGRADSDGGDGGVFSPTASVPPQKKHISFNAIVEQCIAIDSETAPTSPPSRGQSWTSYDDDGYVEDTEDGLYEDVGTGLDDDSDSEDDSQAEAEDEDEVIEIKPPSRRSSFTDQQEDTRAVYETQRRSPVNDSPSVHPEHPRFHQSSTASGRSRRPRHSESTGSGSGSGSSSGRSTELARSRSSVALDREHVTIAPIAPTILKTGGAEDNEDGALYMGGMPYSGYGASHGIVYGSDALPVNRGSGSGGLYGSPGYGYGYGGYGFGECVSAGRSDAFEQFERGTEAGELVYQSPNGNVYPWGEGDAVRFRMRTEYGYAGSPRGSPPRGHGHRARQKSPSYRVGTADVPPSSAASNTTRIVSGPLVKEPSSEGFTDEAEFEYFDAAEDVQNGNERERGSDNRESGSCFLPRGMDDVRIVEPKAHSGANNVDERSSQFLGPELPRERTPSPDFHPKLNPRIASLKHESGYRSPSPSSPSSSATDISGTILSHTSSTTAIPTPGISPAHQEEYTRMFSPPESPVLHAGLLSPDTSPCGRSLCTSPVSGSATSSSVVRSTSRSGSESRSESRGRSRTRNSSLNSSPEQGEPERGRSRSRSNTSAVHGVHSPLSDSSSPQARHPPLAIGGIGTGLGIGGGFGVQHSGREVRDGRGVRLYRKTSEDFIGRHVQQDAYTAHSARGRNRDGKRISESLSPPFVGSSSTGSSISESPSSGTYRSSVPNTVGVSAAESCRHQVSGSDPVLSTPHIGSSPEVLPPSRSPPSISRRSMVHEISDDSSRSIQTSLSTRPVLSTVAPGGLVLPPSIPEEEEQRARHTPDSDRSTVAALPSPAPSAGGPAPEGVSAASVPATVKASSASGNTDEGAGKKFANRTAELVSSARTLLGNIWNPSS